MAATPWILIAIVGLIILLALLAVWSRKIKKRPVDYYAFFIMGIIWLPIGTVTGDTVFSTLGLVFFLIGLVHRKEWEKNRVRWNDLTPKEKKIKKVVIIALLVFLVLGFLFFYIGSIDPDSREKITDFESCAAAGYPVMESHPRQCTADGITYIEKTDVIECKPEQRNVDVCAAIYAPVCGKVNIQCITTPCNLIEETFSNSCEACRNPLVESYRNGEC